MELPGRDRSVGLLSSELPPFLYGTAWKEDETRRLTQLALDQGFRGIDTANQRRHYHEAAVGEALASAIARGVVTRDDLFLQTKFTFRQGQDHRLPYDVGAPVAVQVEQSLASSLTHLGTEVLDSFLLHGPSRSIGLGPDDWEAWRAMEQIADSRRVRYLGISNVTLDQLEQLCRDARVHPRFVQNRCYASQQWDRPVRDFCRQHEIVYQGFSLLTANRQVLAHPRLVEIARRYRRTAAQIVFLFALHAGMLPLTGTSDAEHMRQDLALPGDSLEPHEVALIETLATT